MTWALKAVDVRVPDVDAVIAIGEVAVPAVPPSALRSLRPVVSDVTAARARMVSRRVVAGRAHNGDGAGEVRPGGTSSDNVGSTHCEYTVENAWAVQQISARA